jgi:hypothetical protein
VEAAGGVSVAKEDAVRNLHRPATVESQSPSVGNSPSSEEAMKSMKNSALRLEPLEPHTPTGDTELSTLGLLEDDLTEDTAIRVRPSEPLDEPAVEFIDLQLSGLQRPAPANRETEMKEVEEGGGDSMLARYFRDMAIHPVMGQDEELSTAREVEQTEIALWVAMLAHVPAAEHILEALEKDIAKSGEEVDAPELGELVKLTKKGKKLTVPAGHTWIELVPMDGGNVTFKK